MSYAVKFKDFFGRDGRPGLTLEDSMRLTGAFAGIHDWDFENEIDETFANLDSWTSDAEGSFSISSGQLQIIGHRGPPLLCSQLRCGLRGRSVLVLGRTQQR